MIQITVDEQFEHAAKVYCKKIYVQVNFIILHL